MKKVIYICIVLLVVISCQSQTQKPNLNKTVGGPCEGCEAIFEYGDKKLSSIDTLPDFTQTSPKLKLTGTIYKKDGKTPAKDVLVYIYHTNRSGIYPTKGDEKNWGKRHGYLRGWIKTDKTGKYTFYTFRPAAYPNGLEPEHIHITIKEPNTNEYYIDEIVFEDDPMLTLKARNELENRGGSGLVKPTEDNTMLTANRDIILGFNIPDYE